MGKVSQNEVKAYCESHIQDFHDRRLASLERLKLKTILKKKNPYLFKAKNVLTADELVRLLLDAHLSSQEEGIFGEFLEGLAIFVCEKAYGGRKSSAEGIDLEFTRDGVRYVVSIKSGPNWGNSGQVSKMKANFTQVKRILRSSGSRMTIQAVNGCCYGRDNRPDKGEYFKYCGQRFWAFISGDESLYIDIIKPLGHRARERNESFTQEYAKSMNRFTRQFIDGFCDPDGAIRWPELVEFNSSEAAGTRSGKS